jgi:hypothetical protein
VALAVLLPAAPPAQAGLLAPLLGLMRPQLELRLSQACTSWASGGDQALAQQLQQPCRDLARPASRCLIEETERSGRSLGVVSELLAGRFGDDSEVVVKRCAARLLGLPQASFQDVPLRQLAERFRRDPQAAPPR